MKHFGQYQDGIYLAGLQGVVPKLPIDMATLEQKAIEAWSATVVSPWGFQCTQHRDCLRQTRSPGFPRAGAGESGPQIGELVA
jgi:hypothetical protein